MGLEHKRKRNAFTAESLLKELLPDFVKVSDLPKRRLGSGNHETGSTQDAARVPQTPVRRLRRRRPNSA